MRNRMFMAASALVTLPVLLGLVFFGHHILRLYGPTFDAAYPVLMVLAAASAWVSLVGSLAGFLLTMTDYQREAARIIGASAALNLVLTLILTPMFGMISRSIARLMSLIEIRNQNVGSPIKGKSSGKVTNWRRSFAPNLSHHQPPSHEPVTPPMSAARPIATPR